MTVYRTMLYTLDISSRFLAATLFGKGSIAYCDYLLGTYWRRIFMAGNGKVTRSGHENFTAGRSHVVMSNHASLLDIPAMMAAVPGSVRMVTKEELTKVPVWGPALLASGFIPIDRKNRDKAIAQLEKAKKVLQQGVNVWISPEGTRSRDGTLAAFKKGGFHVARDLGSPIVPAWIEGAQNIIMPDQFVVVPDGHVHVTFGKPIYTAGQDIMAETRAAIVALSGRPDPLAVARAA
jgi:1-acyl-sn-glycerol-3-phosphate acyltransferase